MRLDKWQIYDHPRVNWQPHKGQLIVAENNARHKVVSAGRRWGKALDINTPILTVNGWRTMESIKVGDYVYSWNGQPVEVIAVSEIINERPCYQIDFNGAESIVCDEQHLWYSENKSHRRALSDNKRRKHSFVECIRTTKEMLEQGLRKGKDYNFTIPHTKTLDFQQDLKLSVSPYTLGVWLGDGTSSAAQVTLNEFDSKDIVDRIESEGFTVTKQSSELSWGILGLRVLLRDELKVLDNKHVPKEYLFSSYRDRLSLLQGLMDTDGWVEDTGAIRFSNMNRNVAHSVWHLIVTLGGRVQLSRKKAELNGKNYGMTYELHIVADFPVFSCKRKLNKQFQKTRRGLNNRSVKAITRVESRPVRCITVANEDGMFCAGRDLVPTHNSYMGGVDKLLPEVFITKPIASTLLSEGKKRIFWIVGPNFCLDDETEILTQRGWLHWHNVQPGDQTLGLSEHGECYWDTVQKVNVFDHQGEMLQMKLRGHDSLSTMNHKWFVEYYRASNELRGNRFVESSNLGKANERVPCARPVVDLPKEAKYEDDLVELVAWYWTEGYYRGPGIEIAQSQSANPVKWERIRRALVSMYGSYKYSGNSFYISGDCADEIYQFALGKSKELSYQWITELTRSQLRLFIETSIDADGHRRDRGSKGIERIVAQKNKHNLDVLQMACQLYGWQSNLNRRGTDGLWVLQIFERNQFSPASAFRYGKAKTVEYNGIVWCPTTSSHTWLARRNGTVYFTGNSDSEKEFRVIWNYLKKLEIPMCKPSYNSPETGDMIITLWDGAMQIVAKSAQNPERLVGEGLSGVILSEAAKLKESIWYKYIRPTLADFQGWSFSSSTPEGKNWFYRLWQDGQDPNNPDWASWRMPAWINNYVYRVPTKESDVMKLLEAKRHSGTSVYKLANDLNITIDPEIIASINELTPEAFLQEIAADFTEFVGRVFKEFDEEKHVTDLTFNPGWQTFAAVDYGYCVDTETEILTKDGWKKYDEIGYGTECLTLNTETHLAEWGNVQDVKVFDGEWDMVRMKSKSHDSFTTSNHRWFTKWLGNQKNWDWRWKTSSTFSDNDYVPTALPVTNLPETPKYTDALVELVAWYWTEGSRFSRGGVNRGGEISQNDNHNADRIYAALYETFGPPSESMREGRKNNRGPKWKDWKQRSNADCWDARGYFQLNGPALAPILEIVQGQDKIVSASFVAALTKSQLKLFVETSLAADGANVGASLMISQSKWQRLEPLQMACQLLGYQTVLRKTPQYGPEYGSLTIFQRYNQFHPKNLVQEEKWSGRVWCPTTNNGTWFARRNGTVYATGNCNPNVWLLIQMGPWGEINVLDEIYEEGLDPEDFADEIRWRKLNPGNLRYFFPDPADPGASRILEKKLNIKARGGTGGELNNRINHIRKALREPRYTTDELYIKPDFEVGTLRPKLMFDRRCKRTIEDMLNYRYPEKQAERETSTKRFDSPMKKDDHGPEALGRFFAGMFGQFGKPMTGTTIHSATFRRDESPSAPRDFRGFKDERFTRPAAHEKRREDFPAVNDALGNYLSGAYD